MLLSNLEDVLIPVMIFAIPIVAIIGGITAGIVRTISRHRLIELAQQERIAMIQKGLDPAKLPPLPVSVEDGVGACLSPFENARRRAQGLMIGGFVTLAVGLALGFFLSKMDTGEPGIWAVGVIPGAIGLALLISGILVRPRGDEPQASAPPRAG
jgi:hypothetical protein